MAPAANTNDAKQPAQEEPLRLHIGGLEPKAGWKIFNIQPGPNVDFVGDCGSLCQFADGSVAQIYASHVYEHLGHREELPAALKEAHRVLQDGGLLQVSVPNFVAIARMIAEPQRTPQEQYMLLCHLYGAQADAHDFHKSGLTAKLLALFLRRAGFRTIRRVQRFDLFDDWSGRQRFGRPISLNIEATK